MLLSSDYYELCECIWRQWCNRCIPDLEELASLFSLEHCPEPYLRFGNGVNPLYVLTTNPGGPMDHQHWQDLEAREYGLISDEPYSVNAVRLGEYYNSKSFGKRARTRVQKMISFARQVGHDHVIQVEVLPFHSESLPNKARALRVMASCELLRQYLSSLKNFLSEKSVLGVSACSLNSISTDSLSDWVKQLCDTMSMHEFFQEGIVSRNGNTTGTLLFTHNPIPRGLYLVVGNNNLPAQDGLERMAAVWSRPQ